MLDKNLSQRDSTILSCAETITDIQYDYFMGNGALAPMTLTDVANRMGVHPSTVSRAIRNKYLQCERGTFSIRSLFTRKIEADVPENGSASNAKRIIQELIDGEDCTAPLSDQELCVALAARGIKLSRRTVAKYREQLNISSTFVRKQKN